jgi:predicted cobalt transporter CbtA
LGAATFFGVATGEAGLFFGVAGFFALEALTATGLDKEPLFGEVAGYFGTINAG